MYQLETEIPYDTAKLVGTNCAGFDVYGDRYPKSCYDSFIYMNFEGHKLRGPVGYDEILTKKDVILKNQKFWAMCGERVLLERGGFYSEIKNLVCLQHIKKF